MPSKSVNLGTVAIKNGELEITCSLRAMSSDELTSLTIEIDSLFGLIGSDITQIDKYEPWTPNTAMFAKLVKREMGRTYKDVKFSIIHAGLECGILMKRETKEIEAVALGPTIKYPHSLREQCDLDSVNRTALVVKRIIDGIDEINQN